MLSYLEHHIIVTSTWHLHIVHWSNCQRTSLVATTVPLWQLFKHWQRSRANSRSSCWSIWRISVQIFYIPKTQHEIKTKLYKYSVLTIHTDMPVKFGAANIICLTICFTSENLMPIIRNMRMFLIPNKLDDFWLQHSSN